VIKLATKDQNLKTSRSESRVLLLTNLGSRRSWVVSFSSRSPYPRTKGHQYPQNRRMDGTQMQYRCGIRLENVSSCRK